jgi:hypothetical protein
MKDMNSKRNGRRAPKMFAPAAWQWNPQQLRNDGKGIQVWSASGCLNGTVSVEKARSMVAARAYFLGSDAHICEAYNRTDRVNAG